MDLDPGPVPDFKPYGTKDSQFLNPYLFSCLSNLYWIQIRIQLGHPHPDMMWVKMAHKKVTHVSRRFSLKDGKCNRLEAWTVGRFKKKIIAFFPLLSFIFFVIKNLGSGSRTSNCYTFMMKV
jgi:hypothetical protein